MWFPLNVTSVDYFTLSGSWTWIFMDNFNSTFGISTSLGMKHSYSSCTADSDLEFKQQGVHKTQHSVWFTKVNVQLTTALSWGQIIGRRGEKPGIP